MIDFINGSNKGNEEDDYSSCPNCSEIAAIKQVISDYQMFDTESCAVTIDMLVSEVKMWRAKDSYERKLKANLISSTIKKMEAQGFKINGTDFNN